MYSFEEGRIPPACQPPPADHGPKKMFQVREFLVKDLVKTAKHIYKTSPESVRRCLSPAVRLYHFLRLSYALLRPNVWLIESGGPNPGRLLFCGDAGEKNYIVRTVFSGDPAQTELGRLWIWRTGKLIRSCNGGIDLVMRDMPRVVSGLACGPSLCIPIWVQGDLDFSLTDFSSRSLKEDIRKIRNKYNYTFEVTADRASLAVFYKEMYVPYAVKQYGEELIMDDLEDLLRAAEDIEVLWIVKDGRRVAGISFYYKQGKVMLKWIGVLAGDEELVKAGAIQAIYYYTTNYLKDKGYKRIGIGGSRAFFSDGVLNFKKKWGLTLTHCRHNVLRVSLLRDTAWTRAFLAGNPCIALEGGDLVGVFFAGKDGELTQDEVKGYERYLWPGLKRLVLYNFNNVPPAAAGAPPAVPGAVVRSAKELFDY